jgi:hypothetical protein
MSAMDASSFNNLPVRASWQSTPGQLPSTRWRWLMFRRIGSVTLVLVLMGIMLSLLLSMKRYTPLVAGFGSGYEQPWGPIPMSYEDRLLLERLSLSPESIFQPRVVAWQDASDDLQAESPGEFLDTFVRRFRKARPGGPAKNTIVAYLSIIGTIDAEGRACLVLPRTSETEIVTGSDRFVSVERLLIDLRAAVDPHVNLVVVLDACHGNLAWPLGLTEGAFTVAAQASLDRLQLDRTWVVVSAAAGESSQADAGAGSSAFAKYFAGGLEGAADLSVSGNRDGIVDLQELMTYLQTEVPRYAVSMYGVRQTPQVIPVIPPEQSPQLTWAREPRSDPAVISMAEDQPEIAGETIDAGDGEVDWWLKDRWLVAAAIRQSASHRHPRIWQQYQRLLLRAEVLRWAGVAGQQQLGEVEVLAERLELQLTSIDVANTQYLASLRVRPQATGYEHDETAALSAWTEELKRAVFNASLKPATPIDETYVTVDLWNRRAEAAWKWLIERIEAGGRVDAEMLQRWLDKLGEAGDELAAEPTQVHVARMLLNEVDPEVWRQEPDLPLQLLRQVGRSREACFPEDVRADRLVSLLAPREEADRALRRAIDLTIVGDPASLAEAKQSLAEADAAYTRILAVAQRASIVSDVSDDLYDEFPWLVAWLAREQRIAAMSGGDAAGSQLQQTVGSIDWQATIDTVDRFQRVVGNVARVVLERMAAESVQRERLAEEMIQRVDQMLADASGVVAPIRAALAAAVEDLTSSATDSAETLGRISRILDTPLVRGETRLRLLSRAGRLRRVLRQVDFAAADTAVPLGPTSSEDSMLSWTTWHDIAVHPIVPVLTTTIDGVSTRPLQVAEISASFGKQLAAVRAAIGRLPQTMVDVEQQAARVEAEISSIPPGPGRDAKRIASLITISSGGPQWRQLAGILSQAGMNGPSPVRKSLMAAWHDRLVAAGLDALDDFWAGAKPQSPVWCIAAAGGFLAKAEEVVREARIEHGTLYRRTLRVRLQQLESTSGLSLGNGDYGVLRLDPRVIRLNDRLLLQDNPGNEAILTPELGTPSGIAALRFARKQSETAMPLAALADGTAVLRLPLPVGTQKEPGTLTWQVSSAANELFAGSGASEQGTPQFVDAIASFRGHRLVTAAPLALGSVVRVVEWQPPKPTQPRVTVRGEIPRNRAVAIVFDCSGSMGQRLPDGRTRLEAGRAALYEVLETIARDGGWSVSLWMYGHRTRWTKNDRGEFQAALTKAGNEAERLVLAEGGKFTLLPGDDVEQMTRMQPLVPLQVARIRSVLDAVEPGGETPLYLAIDEAMRADFQGNPGPSHVLVVTDGANDQSGGKITTSFDVRRTLSEVNLRRSPQDQVKIDVIGFDLQPGVYDRQIRLQDMQSLALDSQGRFFDATDSRGLAAALRSSLAIQRWQLLATGGQEPSAAELNQAVVLETPVGGTRQTYDVALESPGGGAPRRVTVEGGEAVELFVARQGSGLEFRRYEGGLEQGLRDASENLPDPMSADRQWFLGAHLARRDGSTVHFPLSVQNGNEDGFSPRPVETWVEVQPVSPTGPVGLPYVFTDPSFQAGRPVPVLDLVALDWPASATIGEIRSWIRFDEAVPEVSVPVASLAPGVAQQLMVSSLPDSTITARVAPLTSRSELVLTVVESHPREMARSLPVLRVSVPRGCIRAVHIVAPETGGVRHEFTVAMIDEQVASDVMLNVTDSRAIKRDAVGPPSPGATPQPLRVVVPQQ